MNGINIHQTLQAYSDHPLTHLKYRADIDGLRAIAVLSVVGFHTFPTVVKGGFIGVDIFFVISGFLISTIIFDSLKRDAFSFIAFYSRRIKRIFPALLLVLVSSFVLGWFVLLTNEYKQLGKHIAGGAGFVSNFVLWGESGYFDNTADTKPLLHLWSLGIEEQYYILWPLLLWAAWKRRFNLLIIATTVAIISAALNTKGINSDIVSTFYSPQTRFWELLAGSILAYLSLHKHDVSTRLKSLLDGFAIKTVRVRGLKENDNTSRNILSFSGAALIAIGFLLITKESAFPGWWAALPVLGSALIIAAGTQAWLNRTVLSNSVLVWFGLISFPLYLWHWPVLSFAGIMESEPLSREFRLAAVLVSTVLAWLTFRLVERPIRFGRFGNAKAATLVCLMVIVGCAGYYCFAHDGLGFRLKDREEYSEYFENSVPDLKLFKRMEIDKNYHMACDFYNIEKYAQGESTNIPRPSINKECYERDLSFDHSVLIWGDSHGAHLYSGLKNNLPGNWQILQVTGSGCYPYAIAAHSTTDLCMQSNWFALKTISEARPDVVIVAQNEFHTIERMNELTEKLRELGARKIIFNGPTPHWTEAIPRTIATRLWINTPNRTFIGINESVLENNRGLKTQFHESPTLKYADLIGLFCNEKGCLTYIGSDKKTGVTSWDEGHLTPIASDYLAKNLLVPLITDGTK